MQLQFCSDLHLENQPWLKLISKCNNLALCGDIGHINSKKYRNYIEYCSELFQNVFVILGNHEYYKTGIVTPQFQHLSNVYVLNNNCVYLDKYDNVSYHKNKNSKIKIIGSTLWTPVNDNISIPNKDCKWIPGLTLKIIRYLNVLAKNYIIKELNENINTILLTHHPIHNIIDPKYKNEDPINITAFHNNLPQIINNSNLKVAINGHTHYNIDTIINGTRLISNQRGHKQKNECLDFDANKIITIELES